MDDKTIMENMLYTVKAASGLFFNGTMEASTSNVRSTFDRALTKSMQIENDIYCRMSDRGWYQVTPVEQQKIDQTAQKFAQMR
ncbi:MAG: coat protein F [Clostridiales bacterium GWF2_36_10]|nr:MAG: coat protein F [Clostridiales bacterium GWF2_36_10]